MSLIELLVAITIFAVGMVIALTIYESARGSYKRGEDRTEQQQSARVALDRVTWEVRLAGLNLYPDGDDDRPDEAIEAAYERAIVIRADFDGDDPARSDLPEASLAPGTYVSVSTGNDEIHGFVLAKSQADGTTAGPDSFTFEADVGQSIRDGTLELVSIDGVALSLADPPYTLYRLALDNDSGQYGSDGFVHRTVIADNVTDLRFRYFDFAGNEISPPGGADDAASVNRRAAIHRVTVELETRTRNPDPTSKIFHDFALADEVTLRNQGKIRIADTAANLVTPTRPATPVLLDGHCGGLVVDWDPSPGYDQISFYRVRYGQDPLNLDQFVATTSTSHYLNNLLDDTLYTVHIEAVNAELMSSMPSVPATIRTENLNIPEAPANVAVAPDAAGGLGVRWDAVLRNTLDVPDAVMRDLAGYRVYRETSAGFTPDASNMIADESAVPALASPFYHDAQSVSCRDYYYVTTAVDKCGLESAQSWEVDGATTTTVAPRAPVGVAAFRAFGRIRLKWDTVRDDVDGDPIWIDDYRIYRAGPVFVGTTPVVPDEYLALRTVSGTTEFLDFPPPMGTQYWYLVKSFDDCGNESDFSAAATAECSFNGSVRFDRPEYHHQAWTRATLGLTVDNPSGTYAAVRLLFTNEDDGTTYQQSLGGGGPSWAFLMRAAADPQPGPFTAGWYTITAEVDQDDGMMICTNRTTLRVRLAP